MPEWKDDSAPRPRPPRRHTFLQRLGSDIGFAGMADATNSRAGIDALKQYDEEEGSGRGWLSFVPGWVLVMLALGLVVFVVFFTSWAR